MKNKTTTKFKTVEEYFSTLPQNTKDPLLTVRDLIQQICPEAEEVISYNIPAFKLNGRNLIYFAAWKEHISIYPIPNGDEAFQKSISSYQGGKGTIKFPISKRLPLALIKKIIKFSMKENLERAKDKKKDLKAKKKSV
ncbi:MAG: DUF1801 domain-containing protein [Leptospiraceae bacterium]|nr:DUF1801 domain-containing protein [Leptospiraceae bacterium]